MKNLGDATLDPSSLTPGDDLDLVRELGRRLEDMEQLVEQLTAAAGWSTAGDDPGEQQHRRLEADCRDLTQRLVVAENQASRLMRLYVITYQLHSTLEPREVEAAIGEIASDLLGAERYALLLRQEDGPACRVALARGFDGEGGAPFADGTYPGGLEPIDRALDDGHLALGPWPGSPVLAVVPLSVQSTVVGALVIFDLVAHRLEPLSADRELLDLLAAHAASALLAARSYATATRKLRTLQGLLGLLGGPA